mmetsp:Transcript_61974/g.166058  ORF Transcript_61974/g.166058 Transcript_61974/m.166058 type:complete len:273 (+) Transcript_61974:228-1046(+)
MFAQAFRLLDPDESNCVPIKLTWLSHFLRIYNLSFAPTAHSLQSAVSAVGANLEAMTFEGLLLVVMAFISEERQRNPRCLFASSELTLLESVFERFLQNAVDGVRTKEIYEIWKALGRDSEIDGRDAQIKMRERILDVDVDLSGTIDFEEFLQLLRLYVEDQEQQSLAVIVRGIRASKFDKIEVMMLQEVFANKSTDIGGVPPLDVQGMLQAAGMILQRPQKELLQKVVTTRSDHEGKLTFESFLLVLRELQDAGFEGVKNVEFFCGRVLAA